MKEELEKHPQDREKNVNASVKGASGSPIVRLLVVGETTCHFDITWTKPPYLIE
jgi:hypothetical protein